MSMNIYRQAADVLDHLKSRSGSVKGLTIGNAKVLPQQRRPLYALVCETLKYYAALAYLVDTTCFLEREPRLQGSVTLALVLVHDTIFSRRGVTQIPPGWMRNVMKKIHPELQAALEKRMASQQVTSKEELQTEVHGATDTIPRYVRVNLLKTTVHDVAQHFQSEGYNLVPTSDAPETLLPRSFFYDQHLSDLLVFPPKTDLHAHPLYLSGDIILQDKASCFPATVLAPPKGSTVIDACAAPGNKTSHLASLMENQGKIYAFDLDRRRLKILEKLTNTAGCQIIETQCQSFLDVDPQDPAYQAVEYILLDPSCSGSGIVSRLDYLVDGFAAAEDRRLNKPVSDPTARLQKLAEFQYTMICHALRFPNLKRLVYSTCSIHQLENEDVVARVLATHPTVALCDRSGVLPTWHRRGVPLTQSSDTLSSTEKHGLSEQDAACLVRCLPSKDSTNGFFVACFTPKAGTTASEVNVDLESTSPVTPEPSLTRNQPNAVIPSTTTPPVSTPGATQVKRKAVTMVQPTKGKKFRRKRVANKPITAG
ncbi:hypothetical protein IWQ62_001391 [Dispira parvispora]|uniref:SAM-dependent MTase RsmB/NOP-type domain-containing protein n=1 Tax=Dispira parvispora TaxID=1520584 RepID=A0A9W8E8L1_9FUNG|nr:hypothetical protein IWQ62_001391 [Dispira parvispora]